MNLDNANLPAYDPQVRYETILKTLTREEGVPEEDLNEWIYDLADVWEMFDMVLALGFTKPDPTPSDD